MTSPPTPDSSSVGDRDNTDPFPVVKPYPGAQAPPAHPHAPWAVPHQAPQQVSWTELFSDAAVPARPRVGQRRTTTIVVVAGVLAVIIATVVGLIFWLRPGSGPSAQSTPTAETTTSQTIASSTVTSSAKPADRAAENALLSSLPAGYPPGSCSVNSPGKNAIASVRCGRNADPAGPASAAFSKGGDPVMLRAGLDEIASTSSVVTCPGNIQSPGPWRRNATPDQVSGTLLCAFQDRLPIVAWTTDAQLTLSVIRADQAGPAIEQLYAWWSKYS